MDNTKWDNDDILSMLSADTLAALKEHQNEVEHKKVLDANPSNELSEDFGMSQFWYDDATRQLLAEEVLSLGGTRQADDKSTKLIACISAPSVFLTLQKMNLENTEVILFEYDNRFAKYGDNFIQYDFNIPNKIPSHLLHAVDCVIADPPYLNKEYDENR